MTTGRTTAEQPHDLVDIHAEEEWDDEPWAPRFVNLADDLTEAVRSVDVDRPIVIQQGEQELAALISMEDFRLYQRLFAEEEDRIDQEAADRALAEAENEGTIPWERVKAELGL